MKNIQIVGVMLVVIGSFLPLVHIPLIGSWNFWQTDHYLAVSCWVFCIFALTGIILNKSKLIFFSGLMLLLLFVFSIIAIRFKTLQFFDFLPVDSWKNLASGIVKLKWGWFPMFAGSALIILAKKNN